MLLTIAQQKALAVVPKLTGFLSIVGSSCIIHSVRNDMKTGEASTYHRLLLGLSAYDVVGSFGILLSTWPSPRGTPGVWGAIGNKTTCTIQGFLVQMVGASPMYNASIGVYFLLQARYNWSDERMRRIEPIMHAIPTLSSFGTGIASLFLKLFNNANMWCWIAPLPFGCKDSFRYGVGGNCIRGDNAWLYRIVFLFMQSWISILIATLSMIFIWWTVLVHEKAVDKMQQTGVVVRTQSRRVANQAFCYLMAFYVVWGPGSVLRLIQSFPGTQLKVGFPLLVYSAGTVPMQGFFNAIVYFRAKFVKHRRDNPHKSYMDAMRHAVFGSNNTEVLVTGTDQIFVKAKKGGSDANTKKDDLDEICSRER